MSMWRFKVIQDGMEVAGGTCPDEATAIKEALHYSMMYSSDGAVKTVVKEAKSGKRTTKQADAG